MGRSFRLDVNAAQTVDKKLFSPGGGRIAFSANERMAEFLNLAIQAKFAYVNKLGGRSARPDLRRIYFLLNYFLFYFSADALMPMRIRSFSSSSSVTS